MFGILSIDNNCPRQIHTLSKPASALLSKTINPRDPSTALLTRFQTRLVCCTAIESTTLDYCREVIALSLLLCTHWTLLNSTVVRAKVVTIFVSFLFS